MTNADRIRQMNNDELAEMIDDSCINIFSCDECEKSGCYTRCNGPCIDWIKKWLNEEYVDGK